MENNSTTFNGFSSEAEFREALPYDYIPTTWICAVFLGLYSITTLLHLSQGMWFHMWWTLPTAVMAGLGEVIGWAARLWSSKSPFNFDPFLMQISTTIIAPTFLIASHCSLLCRIIERLGPQYSRLSPKWYEIIFCGTDFIALAVQAVGGAKSSHAHDNHQDPEPGGHIMLGGIFFQMVTLTIYVILAAEFLTRYNMDKPFCATDSRPGTLTQRLKLQLIGLSIMTFFIFIRTIYRTIELLDGWDGVILATQAYFNIFDGAMILLAMFTLNLFHPGLLLNEPSPQTQEDDIPVVERREEISVFSPDSPDFKKVNSTSFHPYATAAYTSYPKPFKRFEEPLEE